MRKCTNSSTTLCGDPQYRIGFWQNWWHAITRSPILRFFFCDIYTLFIASPYLREKKSLKEEKEAFIHPYFTREKVPWCFCIFPRLPYFETHWDVKRKKNQLTKSSDTDMYPLAIPRYLEICTEIPTKPLQAYFRQFLWVLAWMQYWPLLILNDITPVPGLKPPNPGWTHWSSKRVRCRARL